MAKHTWSLLNRSQDKAKKLIYQCVTCSAIYIKKLNDVFLDDTQCSFTVDKKHYSNTGFDYTGFSGVRITLYGIEYIENGYIHNDKSPAIIYTSHSPMKNEYWFNDKHIEDVESIEEALIKNLLE
jgi:hypothetical protein